MNGFSEYDSYDGMGLSRLVRQRDVSAQELVEEAIGRIERLNPRLNAVIHEMYDEGRGAAREVRSSGPFSGVPSLLKDLGAAYAGVPMRNGSRLYGDYVPRHDSELVRRYRAAGLVFLGKTNTPELGLSPVTEPELFGPTRNPWDPARTPGGSSGGSAAAVAARMVPLAHGNDGGGSIRIPASCCGLFGLKPTRGRNPAGPDVGEGWQGLASDHVLTLSVRDSAAMLDATAGPDVGAPYWAPLPAESFLSQVGISPGRLRIAYTSESPLARKIHPDCLRGLTETVNLCADLGHEVMEAGPAYDGEELLRAFMTVIATEVAAEVDRAAGSGSWADVSAKIEPDTRAMAALGRTFGATDFCWAVHTLHRIGRQVGRFFLDYDVLLTPTLAAPPVEIGALEPRRHGETAELGDTAAVEAYLEKSAQRLRFFPFTPLFNVTGQPAMSVPLYFNREDLPIGMQFAAGYGEEPVLFRLAAQLEEARPWFDRRPDVGG